MCFKISFLTLLGSSSIDTQARTERYDSIINGHFSLILPGTIINADFKSAQLRDGIRINKKNKRIMGNSILS
jgi:hypothetical protein